MESALYAARWSSASARRAIATSSSISPPAPAGASGGRIADGRHAPAPGSTPRRAARRVRHVRGSSGRGVQLSTSAALNFGERAFVNTPGPSAEPWPGAIPARRHQARDRGVQLGHSRPASACTPGGLFAAPPLLPALPRHSLGAPATPETLAYMRSQLPPDALWCALRHLAPPDPHGRPRRCSSAATSASGSRTTSISSAACSAPGNAALVAKAGQASSKLLG